MRRALRLSSNFGVSFPNQHVGKGVAIDAADAFVAHGKSMIRALVSRQMPGVSIVHAKLLWRVASAAQRRFFAKGGTVSRVSSEDLIVAKKPRRAVVLRESNAPGYDVRTAVPILLRSSLSGPSA